MRHKITAAVCVIALIVVGALSVQAYNHYRAKRNAEAVNVSKEEQANARAKATFHNQVISLEALCQKDLASYNALPAKAKATQQAPNCNLDFVN